MNRFLSLCTIVLAAVAIAASTAHAQAPLIGSPVLILTQTEIDNLVNPANGFLVFNSTTNQFLCNLGTPSAPAFTPFAIGGGGGPTPVTGTGTGTEVAFFTGSTTLSSEADFFWDPTFDRLNIGQASPVTSGDQLVVQGSASFRGDQVVVDGNLIVNGNADIYGRLTAHNNNNVIGDANNTTQLTVSGDGTGNWEHFVVEGNTRISRQLRIGSFNATGTPNAASALELLDVNSNARFRGDQVVIEGNLVVNGMATFNNTATFNGRIIGNAASNQIGSGTDATQLTIAGNGSGTADHLYVVGNARVTRNMNVNNELRLVEPGGSNFTAFKAQAQAGDITYTLPATVGSAGNLLALAASPAPTATGGTLEWVAPPSGGGGGSSTPAPVLSYASISANYTADSTDGVIGVNSASAAVTITLPLAADVPAGRILVINIESAVPGSNNVTVVRQSTDTVDGGTSLTLNGGLAAASGFLFYSDGVSRWFRM